jgi:nicotinate-nucleotide pyrophosphorylase (carboxylating)
LILTKKQSHLIDELIVLALEEDIGEGDHTTLACVPANSTQKAKLLVKDNGILCGVEVAQRIARIVDTRLMINQLIQDGETIKPGDIAFIIEGSPRSILSAERLILNCMQRMSGIATYTHKLVGLIKDTKSTIIDTRKTSPGMRVLEKWAVHTGGGGNHRMGLYDMIMIKDNHIDFAGGIKPAISNVHAYLKEKQLDLRIEIEARKLEDIYEIMQIGGINRIMLDNFSPEQIREALPVIAGKYETEASGGINEQNLRRYAETGVDFISVGALTHHVRSLDLSLKAFK